MTKNNLGDLLVAARQMVSAAQANQAQLAAPGGGEAFVQKGAETLAALEAANLEQERLKGLLKTSATQVNELQAQMADWHSQAASVIKLSFRDQKEKWIEFGVTAKR